MTNRSSVIKLINELAEQDDDVSGELLSEMLTLLHDSAIFFETMVGDGIHPSARPEGMTTTVGNTKAMLNKFKGGETYEY